jgi:hypothetical protein
MSLGTGWGQPSWMPGTAPSQIDAGLDFGTRCPCSARGHRHAGFFTVLTSTSVLPTPIRRRPSGPAILGDCPLFFCESCSLAAVWPCSAAVEVGVWRPRADWPWRPLAGLCCVVTGQRGPCDARQQRQGHGSTCCTRSGWRSFVGAPPRGWGRMWPGQGDEFAIICKAYSCPRGVEAAVTSRTPYLRRAFLITVITAASLSIRFPLRPVEPPFCTIAFSNSPYCFLVKYNTTRRASDRGVSPFMRD